jgi:GNAT superfamily N-acetyltransferase
MIRPFEIKDKDSIKYLFDVLTGHDISESDVTNRLDFVNNSPVDFLFVYELLDKVVGLLAFRIRENIEENSRYGEISAIVVAPEFQKHGIGVKLVEFAENMAANYDCMGTWLVSGFGREENAHQFYKAIGYEPTGYRFVKLKR